jgi:plasmid stabilization system protein ParE
MPRGDKSKYSDKQERQADHIEQGYRERGVPAKEAERRAWATVNAVHGGGEKSGSGRGKPENHEPMRKGGRLGGASKAGASRAQVSTSRSEAARKGWETRRRNAGA